MDEKQNADNDKAESNAASGGNDSSKKRTKGGLFDWVDASLKIVIALIGISISILGYSYQKSFTSSQLLVQQEKSDTDIRAQMFGKITERLMRPIEGEQSPVQDTLLAQMLALNFHELIDLKPLMISLDSRLLRSIDSPGSVGEPFGEPAALPGIEAKHSTNENRLREQTEEALENLRSAAKRIRNRQIAALIATSSSESQDSEHKTGFFAPLLEKIYSGLIRKTKDMSKDGFVQYISVVRSDSESQVNQCFVSKPKGENGCFKELMELKGPREGNGIFISIHNPDWTKQTFTVSLLEQKTTPEPEIPEGKKSTDATNCQPKKESGSLKKDEETILPLGESFTVSWYDFPYTDNTLKANGDRYSVFIDAVCPEFGSEPKKPHAVRLGIVYFPKDYYPSRDRPVSYRQLHEKLGWN